MQKALVALATAASTLVLAAPASAQWYPQPRGYGYESNYGAARAMKARVDRIQRDIRHLAQRRMISRKEYRNLSEDSRDLERRILRNARDGRGFTQREAYETQRRIARLEQKIARDMRDGRYQAYRW